MIDGVYYSMDFEEYLSIERLSNSHIQNLIISPATFWASSWLNPNRQNGKDTLAQQLGRAYHCARLEPNKFDDLYAREISKEDFDDDILTTATEISDQLAIFGQAKTKSGESVLDKALRLVEAGYEGKIWHIESDNHNQENEGKTLIAGKYFDQLKIDIDLINSVPAVNDMLSNGHPEVTILWTDNGVKFKARIDLLKPNMFLDFKTYDNTRRKNIDQCLIDAIMYNRYYIQIAFYQMALKAIFDKSLQTIGDASFEQKALTETYNQPNKDSEAWLIFQEKSGVPNVFARQIELYNVPINTKIHEAGASHDARIKQQLATRKKSALMIKAQYEINYAVKQFVNYSEVYGNDQPWVPHDPVGKITEDDFSQYWLERVG